MRCFVAVKISDAVRKKAAEVQEALRRADADVKWVDPESLHLTLKFLGWIDEAAVETLKGLLSGDAARRPELELVYAGVGTFPERGAPRVVWIGCGGDVAGLGDLASAVERAAGQVGVPPEDRPFAPHLTIGRVKSTRNVKRLSPAIEPYRTSEFGKDAVTEIVLFESTLRPQGPIYTPLASFPLGGPGS